MINISRVEILDKSYQNVSGVYMIYSKNTGHIYIGSTVNLYKRYKEHRYAIVRRKHHVNYKINKLVHNYTNDLHFQVWELCSKDDLLKREQVYLDMIVGKSISLNINPTAENCLGVTRRPETVEKIRKSKLGRKASLDEILLRRKLSRGPGNGNYKDGRMSKDYFCTECGNKIHYQTWFFGSKKCYKCFRKTTIVWNKNLTKQNSAGLQRISEYMKSNNPNKASSRKEF